MNAAALVAQSLEDAAMDRSVAACPRQCLENVGLS
jgi:hypothetical protein